MKYIDLQINGCLGVDFSSPNLSKDEILKACDYIFSSGTEMFLPTLITSTKEIYKRNIELIYNVAQEKNLLKNIPGVHLEGPFISKQPGAVGCHDPKIARDAEVELLDELSFVKMVTVAAEVNGVDKFIKKAVEKNIVISLGHQLANTSQLETAAMNGAKCLTHLGNGMPNLVNRHENTIINGLACDDLTAMIITDGHHLPAELIKVIVRTKGVDKVIVTSDASPGAGLPPGEHFLLGNKAILEKNGKLHNPEKQCLVGSSAMMKQCIEFLASLNLLTDEELYKVGYQNAYDLLNLSE